MQLAISSVRACAPRQGVVPSAQRKQPKDATNVRQFSAKWFEAMLFRGRSKGQEQLKSLSGHIKTSVGTLQRKLWAGGQEKRNELNLKRYLGLVAQINALEPAMRALTDGELKVKTGEFRRRFLDGESLDALLVEAFAVVREVSLRKLRKRHYDVQLIGGMVLHEGSIAEMATGEGKTMVAVLPAYLNALAGEPVHVVTVNSYLARRDAEALQPLYHGLGLTVGCAVEEDDLPVRQVAYTANVMYTTGQSLAFDCLRDQTATSVEELLLPRRLAYAIVDEVDLVLLDNAVNPFIISAPLSALEESAVNKAIQHAAAVAQQLVKLQSNGVKCFVEKPDRRLVLLTSEGEFKAKAAWAALLEKDGEEALVAGRHVQDNFWRGAMYGAFVTELLKAHRLYQRDVDYVVDSGRIVLLDPSTGRLAPISRYQNSVHQFIEAKEGVPLTPSSSVSHRISYMLLFDKYDKLSGMTGTAATHAFEFWDLYRLTVITVPPNRPSIRIDRPVNIYQKRETARSVLLQYILWPAVEAGRPLLVGTATNSEAAKLHDEVARHFKSRMFIQRFGWDAAPKLQLLLADPSKIRQEARMVAIAGMPGTVTITTNLAGRGTDIILGGDPEVLSLMTLMAVFAGEVPASAAAAAEWQGHLDSRAGLQLLRECQELMSRGQLARWTKVFKMLRLAKSGAQEMAAVVGKQGGTAAETPTSKGGEGVALETSASSAVEAAAPSSSAGAESVSSAVEVAAPSSSAGAESASSAVEAAAPSTSAGTESASSAVQAAAPSSSAGAESASRADEDVAPAAAPGGDWRAAALEDCFRGLVAAVAPLAQDVTEELQARGIGPLADPFCADAAHSAASAELAHPAGAQPSHASSPFLEVCELVVDRAFDRKLLNLKVHTSQECKLVLALHVWVQRKCAGFRNEVVSVGGLYVLQWGLSPCLRLERQMRGRAGRQGDPGESFVLAFADDEMLKRTTTSNVWTALAKAGMQKLLDEGQQAYWDMINRSTEANDQDSVISAFRGSTMRNATRVRREVYLTDLDMAPLRAMFFDLRDVMLRADAVTLLQAHAALIQQFVDAEVQTAVRAQTAPQSAEGTQALERRSDGAPPGAADASGSDLRSGDGSRAPDAPDGRRAAKQLCVDPRKHPSEWDIEPLLERLRVCALYGHQPLDIGRSNFLHWPPVDFLSPGSRQPERLELESFLRNGGGTLACPACCERSAILGNAIVHLRRVRDRPTEGLLRMERPRLIGAFAPQAAVLRDYLAELLLVRLFQKAKHQMLSRPGVGFEVGLRMSLLMQMDSVWRDFLLEAERYEKAKFLKGYAQLDHRQEQKTDLVYAFERFFSELPDRAVRGAFAQLTEIRAFPRVDPLAAVPSSRVSLADAQKAAAAAEAAAARERLAEALPVWAQLVANNAVLASIGKEMEQLRQLQPAPAADGDASAPGAQPHTVAREPADASASSPSGAWNQREAAGRQSANGRSSAGDGAHVQGHASNGVKPSDAGEALARDALAGEPGGRRPPSDHAAEQRSASNGAHVAQRSGAQNGNGSSAGVPPGVGRLGRPEAAGEVSLDELLQSQYGMDEDDAVPAVSNGVPRASSSGDDVSRSGS